MRIALEIELFGAEFLNNENCSGGRYNAQCSSFLPVHAGNILRNPSRANGMLGKYVKFARRFFEATDDTDFTDLIFYPCHLCNPWLKILRA